jgi:hypothetical protein
VAAIDEGMPDGADRVALADARQTERQDIGGVVQEVAVGELMEATHQRRRQAAFIERVERFPWRELGRPAQAGDPALVPLVRFELQDVEQERECRLLLRLNEA